MKEFNDEKFICGEWDRQHVMPHVFKVKSDSLHIFWALHLKLELLIFNTIAKSKVSIIFDMKFEWWPVESQWNIWKRD
jgi:hypothetical protein